MKIERLVLGEAPELPGLGLIGLNFVITNSVLVPRTCAQRSHFYGYNWESE